MFHVDHGIAFRKIHNKTIRSKLQYRENDFKAKCSKIKALTCTIQQNKNEMIQTRHNNELKAAQTRNLIKKMNLEKLSIENDYKELKSKVGQLRNENFDKTREINNLYENKKMQNVLLEELKIQVLNNKSNSQEFQQTLSNFIDEDNKRIETITTLNSKIDSKDNLIRNLEIKNEQILKENENKSKEITKINNELIKLKEQINSSKESDHSSNVEKALELTEMNQILTNKLEKESKKLNESIEKVKEFMKFNILKDQDIAKYKEEITRISCEKDELATQMNSLNSQLSRDLENLKQSSAFELSELRLNIEYFNKTNMNELNENIRLTDENSELTLKLKTQESKIFDLKSIIKITIDEKLQLKIKLKDLQEELNNLKINAANKADEIQELKRQLEEKKSFQIMSENKGTNTCETDNVKQLKSSIQRLTKSCREKNDERKELDKKFVLQEKLLKKLSAEMLKIEEESKNRESCMNQNLLDLTNSIQIINDEKCAMQKKCENQEIKISNLSKHDRELQYACKQYEIQMEKKIERMYDENCELTAAKEKIEMDFKFISEFINQRNAETEHLSKKQRIDKL